MSGSHREARLLGHAARFVVLTGLSGAGKSQAIHALEDLGYFCVDNLPTSLLPALADLAETRGSDAPPTAVVVDMRDPAFLERFPPALQALRRRKSLGTILIFLEANDNALVRRFSETRRPHPLAADQAAIEGILKERKALEKLRQVSDKVFDTSELTVHELRRAFIDLSRVGAEKQLVVTVLSFGYKHGVPLEADLLFDVRFLPNPHFVPALRPLTGCDQPIKDFLNDAEATGVFLGQVDRTAALSHSAVRGGGEELSDGGRRLHGRPASLGDGGGSLARPPGAPGWSTAAPEASGRIHGMTPAAPRGR